MNNQLKIDIINTLCINIIQFNQIITDENFIVFKLRDKVTMGSIDVDIIGLIPWNSDIKVILNKHDDYFLTIQELIDFIGVDFDKFIKILCNINGDQANKVYFDWFELKSQSANRIN